MVKDGMEINPAEADNLPAAFAAMGEDANIPDEDRLCRSMAAPGNVLGKDGGFTIICGAGAGGSSAGDVWLMAFEGAKGQDCAEGSVKDSSGSCEPCAAGTFQEGAECEDCPSNEDTGGSGGATSCACKETFVRHADGACVASGGEDEDVDGGGDKDIDGEGSSAAPYLSGGVAIAVFAATAILN